jgi:hypothetical protein
MNKLWIGFAMVIAYGSVYPFNFQASGLDGAFQAFFETCCRPPKRGDVLGNVLLFVPFGFLGILGAKAWRSVWSRIWLVCVTGIALALVVQVVQIFLPSRDQSLQDVVWNFVGLVAGIVLGAIFRKQNLASARLTGDLVLIPCLLVGCWLAYRLIPFVPSIDFASIKDSIRPLLVEPRLESIGLIHDMVAWTVIAGLMSRAKQGARWDRYLPILMIGVFCLEVLIVHNVVHLSNVVGAVLALILWWGVLRPVTWQAGGIAILLGVMLIVAGLAPYTASQYFQPFNWLPFGGLLGGSMYINALAISEKVFLYGSLVYYLGLSRVGIVIGTLIAVLVVAFIEIAQTSVGGHTPEITDPILVVLAAFALTAFGGLEARPGGETSRRRSSAGESRSRHDVGDKWPRKQTINLHRGQAEFLVLMGKELGVQSSEACCLIIDMAVAGKAEETAQQLRVAAERVLAADPLAHDHRLSRNGGSERWLQLSLALDEPRFRALASLSNRSRDSISGTVRHLVAGFIDALDSPGNAMPANASTPDTLLDDGSRTESPKSRSRRRRRESRKRRIDLRKALIFGLAPAGMATLGLLLVFGSIFDFGDDDIDRGPQVIVGVPWAARTANVIFDHHTHSYRSDGESTVAELVEMARDGGCNALVISDHSDSLGAASDDQLREFNNVRRANPGFVLFGGLEINMPSYSGREHVNIISTPAAEVDVLPALKEAAEARNSGTEVPGAESLDFDLLRIAAEFLDRGDPLVAIYNHPSRKDKTATENYADFLRWNRNARFITAFSGAPGHQKSEVIGAYRDPIMTTDRWDPVVAEVGGTWDRLLSEGHQVWGAIAGSDYHNNKNDWQPCEFSRTHIAAAEPGYEAILEALQAGTFWAGHGKILNEFRFSAQVTDLALPAYPGSVVDLGSERSGIRFRATVIRGDGAFGEPLQVEFIGNCRIGVTEVLAFERLEPAAMTALTTIRPEATGADKESCYVRARVRLEMAPQPDLMAYSNPIRFIVPR